MQLGSASVPPLLTERDLGFHINTDVPLKTHVSATVRACFSVLRHILIVCRSLTPHALIALLRALANSKVDYCCSALVGISAWFANQPVTKCVEHCSASCVQCTKIRLVTPYLRDLDWLKITEGENTVSVVHSGVPLPLRTLLILFIWRPTMMVIGVLFIYLLKFSDSIIQIV